MITLSNSSTVIYQVSGGGRIKAHIVWIPSLCPTVWQELGHILPVYGGEGCYTILIFNAKRV